MLLKEQNGLNHFTAAIGGNCPLKAVNVKMIDTFVDHLTSKGLSINSTGYLFFSGIGSFTDK